MTKIASIKLKPKDKKRLDIAWDELTKNLHLQVSSELNLPLTFLRFKDHIEASDYLYKYFGDKKSNWDLDFVESKETQR